MEKILLKIKAGNISSASLGTSKLGSCGAPIKKIIQEINQLTKNETGMKTMVEIQINIKNPTKYRVIIPKQPSSHMLLKLVKLTKGNKAGEKIAELSKSDLIKFTETNFGHIGDTLNKRLKQIEGICKSMGIKII